MNLIDAISARIAAGTLPCSSMSCAIGNSFSVAKERAVRCTSACDSVRARSNAAPDSVVVVVAMSVLLTDVDADEPAVGIAREEVVAVEVADDGLGGPRLVVRGLHVVHAEPHDEAGLRADLRRRLAVVRRVEHDVRVAGFEPAGVRIATCAGREADEVAIEARRRGVLLGEREHRADLRSAHDAYSKKPRPLLRPSQPASTY